MAADSSVLESATRSQTLTFQQFAVEQVLQWCDVLDHFIQWQSQCMLKASPSPQQQEDHRQGLKWLLRLTKLIHSVASDPEFPDKSLLCQLEAQMCQLEESWELFYNQMPEAAAEKILAEAFPNGR
jgi:hypothetical protein